MPASNESHFIKLQSFKSSYADAEFTQYESTRTGLRVVVVDRQSSKVQGEFCLATEIHDDSGAPHTLEHLIFMGSKSYQYKGVLDRLANRAYSSTNAWTDVDHTNYTLETAGWEGFSQILPIYLEHIILPTLTDSACYTEVHHVDAAGNDAGVVYSEMQALQNTASEILDIEARKHMFPKSVGFRYETGGMMDQLRVLTNDQIRRFHKLMYQPKNLRLCISGQVDHVELLKILERFEMGILAQVPTLDEPFKRPWIDSVAIPRIEKDVLRKVEFPEEDESMGEISIGMFGPDYLDHIAVRALSVVTEYLAGSSASIVQNILVEQEQLASSVDIFSQTRPRMVIWILLSSVETSKLESTEKRFWEVMIEAVSGPLDMQYLKNCLSRLRRQIVYEAEVQLGAFTEDLIYDHLYCNRDGRDLEEALRTLDGWKELEEWSERDWQDFFKQHFIDNRHVTVLGVPSAKLSERLKAAERDRIQSRLEKLGTNGLKDLAKKLEDAKDANDVLIPDEVFRALPVPNPDTITWLSTITAKSGLACSMNMPDNHIQRKVDRDAYDLPLFIHFEHTPAKCLYFSLILFADGIPTALKPLLSIFLVDFFTTPLMRNDTRVEFEEVVKTLERDTIDFSMESGSVNHTEAIRIRFVVEQDKYSIAIEWLRDLLFNRIFDVDRIDATISKLLADIPSSKRDGSAMAAAIDDMVHFSTESSRRAQNVLVKAVYLKRVKRLLKTDPKTVTLKLTNLCQQLFKVENMRALVVGDIEQIQNPVSSWKILLQEHASTRSLRPIMPQADFYSDAARQPGQKAYLVPMGPIDSSYGYFTAQAPKGYFHPRLPALLLALAYLDTADGPLWVAVRGSGLAYGTTFSYAGQTGILKLSIYRSPDAYKAYEAARQVVHSYVKGEIEVDDFSLEGAVSNIVLQFANEQVTMIQVGLLGFVNPVILEIPRDYGKTILREIRKVSTKDMVAAIEEFVLPVFEPETANMVITCSTDLKDSLEEGFKKRGFRVEIKNLDFFQDDYGFEAARDRSDGEQDEDDEDQENEEEEDSDDSD